LSHPYKTPFGQQAGHIQRFHVKRSHARWQRRDFIVRLFAFHRHPQPPVCERVSGESSEVSERGESPSRDDIERLRSQGLDACMFSMEIGQGQLTGDLTNEGGLLSDRIDARDVPSRFGNRQYDPRQAAATANVEDARRCRAANSVA
jgi:hypothetical protein